MIQPGFNSVGFLGGWGGGRGDWVSVVATVSSFKFILKLDAVSSIFLNIFFKIVDVLVLSQLCNYFD